jgi:hypothetical protein
VPPDPSELLQRADALAGAAAATQADLRRAISDAYYFPFLPHICGRRGLRIGQAERPIDTGSSIAASSTKPCGSCVTNLGRPTRRM